MRKSYEFAENVCANCECSVFFYKFANIKKTICVVVSTTIVFDVKENIVISVLRYIGAINKFGTEYGTLQYGSVNCV